MALSDAAKIALGALLFIGVGYLILRLVQKAADEEENGDNGNGNGNGNGHGCGIKL